MDEIKMDKSSEMVYKVPHRKLKVEQQEPHQRLKVNTGVTEGQAVPATQKAPVV